MIFTILFSRKMKIKDESKARFATFGSRIWCIMHLFKVLSLSPIQCFTRHWFWPQLLYFDTHCFDDISSSGPSYLGIVWSTGLGLLVCCFHMLLATYFYCEAYLLPFLLLTVPVHFNFSDELVALLLLFWKDLVESKILKYWKGGARKEGLVARPKREGRLRLKNWQGVLAR